MSRLCFALVNFFMNLFSKLRKSREGYVAILLAITAPVLLLGVKYTIDMLTINSISMEKSRGQYHKKCAKEASLAVAKNWNPGLTLEQQKDALLKVADAVYNANPCHNDSVVGNAVPGIDIKKDYKVDANSAFGGMVVSSKTFISPLKIIEYTTEPKHINRWCSIKQNGNNSLWNPYYAMWLAADKASDSNNRISIFDEINEVESAKANYVLNHHNIYGEPKLSTTALAPGYPTNEYFNSNGSNSSYFYYDVPSFSNDVPGAYGAETSLSTYSSCETICHASNDSSYYKKRVISSDQYCVQISIEDGKIKAQTDNDVGYAIPAECNVDIVLAIPVNGAANNVNNRDAASDMPENPLSETNSGAISDDYITENAKLTPIYQIGQACKNFVKDNFYHTSGVNIGLIPYSGKVSISPDKTHYAAKVPAFITSYFQSDLSTFQTLSGAFLYGTRGENGAKLENTYSWGTILTGCPIMCRRGLMEISQRHGNNVIAYGDLFSNCEPNTAELKFQQMNLNPCYMGYANLLGLRCENTCTTYLPNPYYMIEPTADLVKIYEMCNAMYPIFDPQNVSNFIFIPVTWANNFFQSWTNDPSKTVVAGGQLPLQSKNEPNRKKALILLVNKPDWFEPGELTYIGFDNDASEISMAETDKIDFSIDYSDTTKKFLDGTAYDGTIAGPKKIIKYTMTSGTAAKNEETGDYICENGTGRLTFPTKGIVKIIVSSPRSPIDLTKWVNHGNLLSSFGSSRWWNMGGIAFGAGKFVAVSCDGYVAYSSNGINWNSAGRVLGSGNWEGGACYGAGKFVVLDQGSANVMYSSDAINWSRATNALSSVYEDFWHGLAYGNGKFVAVNEMDTVAHSIDGINWSRSSDTWGRYGGICYGAGKFVAMDSGGDVICSYDGENWEMPMSNLWGWGWWGLCYTGNEFVTTSESGQVACSTDGINWNLVGDFLNFAHGSWSTGYGNNKIVAVSESGYVATCNGSSIGDIQSVFRFKSVADSTNYILTEEKIFIVNPSEILSTDGYGNYYIEFDMENVRLISAEISNLQTDKLTPINATYKEVDMTDFCISNDTLSCTTEQTTVLVTDTINFAAGSTSGGIMSYSTISGTVSYNDGKGLDTVANAVGRITIFQNPTANVTLLVEKALSGLQSIASSGWNNYGGLGYNGGKVLAVNSSGYVAYSTDDGKTWTSQGRSLSSITTSGWIGGTSFGNGKWLAVSSSGYVGYSTDDGKTWTSQGRSLSSIATSNWNGGASFGNGKWLAVNKDGYVACSTDDGKTWTSYGNPLYSIYNGNWNGGAFYANGKWLAVNINGYVAYSMNGETWTSRGKSLSYIGSGGFDAGATYGNGRWVIANVNRDVDYSTNDGQTWTLQSTNLGTVHSGNNVWTGLCYSNSNLLLVSRDIGCLALSSDNGKTWVLQSGSNSYNIMISPEPVQTVSAQKAITIAPSQFISNGDGSYYVDLNMCNIRLVSATTQYEKLKDIRRLTSTKSGTILLTVDKSSADGLDTWVNQGNKLNEFGYEWSVYGNTVAYGNDKFIVISSSGVVAYSSDGIVWNRGGIANSGHGGACFGNGKFVSLDSGSLVYSTDGITWTSGTTPYNSYPSAYDDDIVYGGGKFLTTPDGLNVQISTSVSDNWASAGSNLHYFFYGDYNKLAYGNGKFIIYQHSNGNVAYSSDGGITWASAGEVLKYGWNNSANAIGFGSGKFVFVHDEGYVAYSADGINWEYAGGSTARPLYTATSQTGWSGITFGNGKWVAVNLSGCVATCVESISSECTIKIGSDSPQTINGLTTIEIPSTKLTPNGSGGYYVDIDTNNVALRLAAIIYDNTEPVDDIIDFCTSTSSKSGILSAYASGFNTKGLYTCTSGTGSISASKRGAIELTIAPALGSESSTFEFNSGSDMVRKNISGKTNLTIKSSDLTKNDNVYSISFNMSNIILLKAKFNWIPTIAYPEVANSRRCDWSENFVSPSSVIGLGRTYSNFNKEEGYHQIKSEYCYPIVYPLGYVGDVTVILDAKYPFVQGITMPEYLNNDANMFALGHTRIFSPMKRSSSCNYCDLKSYSTSYDDKANLISTDFTIPLNTVLYKAKYQENGETSNAAIASVTRDACHKLKSDYENDIRIYVIKYRKQDKYKSFPFYDVPQTNIDHGYSIVDSCASGDLYRYDISSEKDLNDILKTIAADIKSFAGYQEAKNVENSSGDSP